MRIIKRAGAGGRRRFWFDPRFAIGLVLVGSSVGGVAAIVSTADDSVHVYAARQPLAQGDLISSEDLVASSVRFGTATELYLTEGDLSSEGLVVTKPVAAGELVPASAVGSASGVRYTAVVVTLASRLAGSLGPGSLVDLWASREMEAGAFGPPAVLVPAASVVRILEPEGLVVDDTAASVELLVPRSKIARVLEALANQDALSLVPVSLPARN